MRQGKTQYFRTREGDTIALNHVCMTRWDKKHVKELMIFFATGPHIALEEPEGKEFEKVLIKHLEGM